MTDKPNKNSLREAAREKVTEAAFIKWLTDQKIEKITPKDGHARRAFDAGYDAGYQDASAQPSGPGEDIPCATCGHLRTDHDYHDYTTPYQCGLEFCQCTDYSPAYLAAPSSAPGLREALEGLVESAIDGEWFDPKITAHAAARAALGEKQND